MNCPKQQPQQTRWGGTVRRIRREKKRLKESRKRRAREEKERRTRRGEEEEENWPVANMMAKLWVRSQRPAEAAVAAAAPSAKRRSNGVVSI